MTSYNNLNFITNLLKKIFLKGYSWFNFNNLGLIKGLTLKLYTTVAKGLKLKVRKFLGLVSTGENLTGGGGGVDFGPTYILNKVKNHQS